MSRVETHPSLRGRRQFRGVSTATDAETGDEETGKNWYFWSRHSATLGNHYGSESITTVYAVKAAIGRTPRKGWYLTHYAV